MKLSSAQMWNAVLITVHYGLFKNLKLCIMIHFCSGSYKIIWINPLKLNQAIEYLIIQTMAHKFSREIMLKYYINNSSKMSDKYQKKNVLKQAVPFLSDTLTIFRVVSRRLLLILSWEQNNNIRTKWSESKE